MYVDIFEPVTKEFLGEPKIREIAVGTRPTWRAQVLQAENLVENSFSFANEANNAS
jgi:hypothetical protein